MEELNHPGALPETLASLVRHLLTLGAGYLVGKGLIPNALIGDVVTIGMALAAFGWSAVRIKNTQKVLKVTGVK